MEDNAYLRDSLLAKFETTMFLVDKQIMGLDAFKRSYEALCERADTMMASMDGFMEK